MVKSRPLMEKSKKIFNHLKIHTQYSICEGAIKIDELSKYCKDNKVKAIGMSDTSNLCGSLEFSEQISKSKTQPIIGSQINFKFNDIIGSLPIIAKNSDGYKELINLSSKSFLENSHLDDPHCKIELLFNCSKNLIILSGGINNLSGVLFQKGRVDELEKLYVSLSKNSGDNFYIEIQRHGDLNEKNFETFNLSTSKKINAPIIATNEVYYLNKEMSEAHDALLCIGSKNYINDKQRIKLTDNHYLKSDDEMRKIFSDLPVALENNYNLPLRCSFRPEYSKPLLPNINSNNDISSDDQLKKDANDGLIKKFKEKFEDENLKGEKFLKYKKRLDHEINIICEMNYSSYFLIVSDYIIWAKKKNIPVGPGRGSGAGSLVAWCLQITDVDPIYFDLIFERFLNPDRISMPDFDIDFCEEKRDLVFEYLNKKYKDSVAHIITFGKLKARMVIRDVGRVMGLPYGFVDSICKMIPFDPSRPMSLTECINSEPRLKKMINEDKRVDKLIKLSLKLEGLNRNFATHAAGVVIADKKLIDSVPLYKDTSSNLLLPSTQFDMYSAENSGLIKFDFLGLKTLTVINNTIKLLNKKKIDFNINKINYEDQTVFDLLSSGKTVGLFQLESSGMRDALTQMKPNRLEDIIALVALYRPGPMNNIPIYNDCKNGKRSPDYLHPKLENILKSTYGVIIYQEQVMQIAQVLSGFTAGEADILRRAMGKKKRAELEKQKARFIDGAYQNGIPKDVAASIFLKIEPFAEYGFNKSHAAAYAIIAYQTAYLKTHFTNEFFSASMSMEMSNQKKLGEFYEELKRLEIDIISPNINLCNADFYSDTKNFYYALGALKNVGYEAISNIVKERDKNGEFKSLNDFINRVNPKDINKLQMEALTKAGAFDNIFKDRKSIFESIPNLILKSKNIFENKSLNQIDLFANSEETNKNELVDNLGEWSFQEKMAKEFETVGFFISDHPLNQYQDIFKEFNILSYKNINEDKEISEGSIAATILKIQEKKTQKGTSYAIIKFSDQLSIFELFIFSDILDLNRGKIKEGNSVILSLQKISNKNEPQSLRLNVKKIISLDDLINRPINSISFKVKNVEEVDILSKMLKKGGDVEVSINVVSSNKAYKVKLKDRRFIDRKMVNLIKNQGILMTIH